MEAEELLALLQLTTEHFVRAVMVVTCTCGVMRCIYRLLVAYDACEVCMLELLQLLVTEATEATIQLLFPLRMALQHSVEVGSADTRSVSLDQHRQAVSLWRKHPVPQAWSHVVNRSSEASAGRKTFAAEPGAPLASSREPGAFYVDHLTPRNRTVTSRTILFSLT